MNESCCTNIHAALMNGERKRIREWGKSLQNRTRMLQSVAAEQDRGL